MEEAFIGLLQQKERLNTRECPAQSMGKMLRRVVEQRGVFPDCVFDDYGWDTGPFELKLHQREAYTIAQHVLGGILKWMSTEAEWRVRSTATRSAIASSISTILKIPPVQMSAILRGTSS